MKLNCKKALLKILSIMSVVVMSFSFNSVNASTNGGISTYSYYGGTTATFYGSKQFANRYYEGTFMAVEATATASDNQSHKVTLKVNIINRNTVKTYTLYTNGQKKKFDYIGLGLSGGSSVIISCTCDNPSVAATIDLTTYSW